MSRRHAIAGGLALLVLGSTAVAACLGRGTGGVPASLVAPGAKSAVDRRDAAAPPPSPLALQVVLDDPAFEEARTKDAAKDFAGAATAFREARTKLPVDAQRACAWDYVEGRLLASASALEAAAASFDEASAPQCPLAPWAKLRAGQALARAGKSDAALARARVVLSDPATKAEAELLVAEALHAKGDVAGALPLLRAAVAAGGYGPRWVDTHVRVAQALLDGIGGPVAEHAREAYDLATKVVVEAPKLADAAGATDARARAVQALAGTAGAPTLALSDAERARQAQALLDLAEQTKAFELASSVLRTSKKGGAACKAAVTRANAAPKAIKAKGEVWNDAVAACAGDDALVATLYNAAKARAGKDPAQAAAWFKQVEEKFPTHRLADDARFRRALLTRDQGEEGGDARSDELLRTLPDAFPEGDMRAEALFRVAQSRFDRGEYAAAKPWLDRVMELTPHDRHWATAGRAAYFRARVAEKTGDRADAAKRYREVVSAHPLAYYMLIAYGRLEALSRGAAAEALAEGRARDRAEAPTGRALEVLSDPAVIRGARLLEVGEVDGARRELARFPANGEDGGEAAWTLGGLYVRAGHPELGHAFARGPKVPELYAHWPEGKWRAGWEAAYPRAWAPLVEKACEARAVPRSLAWAIMREESSFYPEVKSPANAFGLMQLIVPTAAWVAAGTPYGHDEASLKTPPVSIGLGVKLLGTLNGKHRHPALAAGAYNAGSGAVDRWMRGRAGDDLDAFVERIPYDETRNYVKRVLASQAAYAYLDGEAELAKMLALPLALPRIGP